MIMSLDSSLLSPGPPSAALLGSLVRTLDKSPVDVDGLAEKVCSIQLLASCQGLLVSLVLDQSVSLEESCPPVQVEVNIFDLSILGEPVVNVVLLSLLVNTSHKQDPALNGTLRSWAICTVRFSPIFSAQSVIDVAVSALTSLSTESWTLSPLGFVLEI